ncbi:MAG: tRNA preQ1(34) S-adenosylmethionine ribosyltransferase-isomerase QueA [Zetaproteobacteria bacterium CG12_big_fil_rev_8_21_14_0_65_54_13]|nr:MAG: tRNA preQ1(34) S-adenosylmethionine ribosyltransferase-isomerase QueA [Zetaproteobacteria bacterium CG23_combo_of_CG06-09_8_20_14_all_54_7]PIW47141.1 MAG: tRNA preQ1(34) S-adenosylmethionine ribosyltransferase-isomerase QueA [Zetaproteobacteria bacterium CG12_big_fil_rev_8_21_14_0_65_54_13]PIX55675.1 MAG: tRNA preQ1(34) S-adenosylmethionine ribosyltransferase-isomerase QueA [Zetaproteobacteria bacterium CG_4_10_14_3_um_filter_54_28]PJA30288.1 MAG: tRNA preQ1(34) S-adenosylmethionine ribo
MRVSDYDFHLPEHCIASQPLRQRDAARLLDVSAPDGTLADRWIRELAQMVQPGDLWVINDTKVIPARLVGQKQSGGKAEVLLLEATDKTDVWRAWGKANKPLKAGTVIAFSDTFSATVLAREGKDIIVALQADDVPVAIETYGHMPLPPYINRPDSEEDKKRYQTVFARHAGAVAAPTAGLHLTTELMRAMQDAGAEFAHVTLHVGPGTFQPVQVEHLDEHVMHEEGYIVSAEAAAAVNRARAEGRRVVAVGTTSLRTLEAAGQSGELVAGSGRTSIFITSGYHFRMVDALLTNFHLPKSTLIMLVSALAGRERVLAAYEHAKQEGYRFYSYGDAMFVSLCRDKALVEVAL